MNADIEDNLLVVISLVKAYIENDLMLVDVAKRDLDNEVLIDNLLALVTTVIGVHITDGSDEEAVQYLEGLRSLVSSL